MNDLAIEKKRLTFNYFKNWEFKRKQQTNIYKSIADSILGYLLNLGNSSLEGFNTLIKFLKEKKKQNEKFARPAKLPVFGDKKGVFEKNLELFWECDQKQREKFRDFSKYIEEELLLKGMEDNQAKYSMKMDAFKKIESKLRSNMIKLEGITAEKYSEYSQMFSATLRGFIEEKQFLNKDLFVFEQLFLFCASETFNNLIIFIKETKNIWDELRHLEYERVILMNKSLKLYVSQHKESIDYSKFEDLELKLDSNYEQFNAETSMKQLFDLNSLITPEQGQYLKQKEK